MKKNMIELMSDSWYMNSFENKNINQENVKKTKKIFKVKIYNSDIALNVNYITTKKIYNLFKFEKCIYAVEEDFNHIREIRTGMIFPIVCIDKENHNLIKSHVKYASDQDDYSSFAIRENSLLNVESLNIKELEYYLNCDELYFNNYFGPFKDSSSQKVKKL